MSAEHLITRGAWLSPTMLVGDGPWGEPRRLPLDGVVTKCLCKEHNQQLSELDVVGIDSANAFRELFRLRTTNQKDGRTFVLDGPRFERWVLKCVLNAASAMRKQLPWSPSHAHAAMVFGHAEVPNWAQLRASVVVGDRIERDVVDQQRTEVRFQLTDASGVTGAMFYFFGVRYVLALQPQHEMAGRWSEQQMTHRPKRFRSTTRTGALVNVTFDWRPRATYSPSATLLAARARYPAPPR